MTAGVFVVLSCHPEQSVAESNDLLFGWSARNMGGL